MKLPPAPGHFVDVGGAPMHVVVTGTGSPTVVCESGLGGSVLEWASIAAALEGEARVVRRDRFGLGFSQYVKRPRDGASLARELHSVLEASGVVGPFVLVGHSLGAMVVRSFAAQYPDEVIGVVLVDGTPGEYVASSPAMRRQLKGLSLLSGLLSPKLPGGQALYLRLERRMMPADAAEDKKGQVRDLVDTLQRLQPGRGKAIRDEYTSLLTTCAQMQGLTMPPVPLQVLSQGRRASKASRNKLTDVLRSQHAAQAQALSPYGQHIIAADSGHLIPIDEPDVVVRAVRAVLASRGSSPA